MNFNFYISTLAVLLLATVNALRIPIISDIIDSFESDKSIDVPEDGGDYDLDIASHSSFSINLDGNPTTGYGWYLDNEAEIKASNIVLVGQDYAQKDNPEKMVGTGGQFIFNFKVNEACTEVLPDLFFVYKRSWETEEPIATATITLKAECEKKQDKKAEEDHTQSGSAYVTAKVNEPFKIEIVGNPTTGYEWIFQSTVDVERSPLINYINSTYVEDEHEEGMVGVGGTFVFEFEVNEDSCNQVEKIPILIFSYKRSWEPLPIDTVIYRVRLDKESCKPYMKEEDIEERRSNPPEKYIDVEDNKEFHLSFIDTPSNGYTYELGGIDGTETIKFIGMEFVENNENKLDGAPGRYVFTFKAEGFCKDDTAEIRILNKRSWLDDDPYPQLYRFKLHAVKC